MGEQVTCPHGILHCLTMAWAGNDQGWLCVSIKLLTQLFIHSVFFNCDPSPAKCYYFYCSNGETEAA